jgi:hypothetical protein
MNPGFGTAEVAAVASGTAEVAAVAIGAAVIAQKLN